MNYEGQLKGHRGWVTSLACPQQADSAIKVVSTSRDGTAISWVRTPECCTTESDFAIPDRRLEGHTGFVSSIALAHISQYAVTSSWDRSLRLWNLRTGQCQRKFIKHTKDVLTVAFSHDDRQIVSGGRDNVIRVWNVMGDCMHELTRDGHEDWVSSVAFSPVVDKPIVVSGGWDNAVKVWDLSESKLKYTLKGHTNYVTSVTVSPDGSLCASGSKDGVARLWDLNTGEFLFEIKAQCAINQIAFSPNRFWMSVATDENVRVYDLEAKTVIVELAPETTTSKVPACNCLAWSADGTTLYTGHSDNIIRAWSVSDSSF